MVIFRFLKKKKKKNKKILWLIDSTKKTNIRLTLSMDKMSQVNYHEYSLDDSNEKMEFVNIGVWTFLLASNTSKRI